MRSGIFWCKSERFPTIQSYLRHVEQTDNETNRVIYDDLYRAISYDVNRAFLNLFGFEEMVP